MAALAGGARSARTYTAGINPLNENGYFKTEETELDDGTYTLVATQADEAGNKRSASLTFIVDTTDPVPTIDSGPSGPTSDTTPTFEFSANEASSTFECSPVAQGDPADFTACSGPGDSHTPDPALAEGDYSFSVRATDEAGNLGPASTRGFTVDTPPPTRRRRRHPPRTSPPPGTA